jgi:hypothetical protein
MGHVDIVELPEEQSGQKEPFLVMPHYSTLLLGEKHHSLMLIVSVLLLVQSEN